MNVNPLVSVIIPAYNAGKYIEMAVKSVLNQSYTNIELIVVNDGSTDNTLDVLSQFSDIKIISTSNRGVSHARNVGIDASRGEFVSFLDADDELKDDAVDSLLKTCIKNNSDICEGLFASDKYLNKNENQEICYKGDFLLCSCIDGHPCTYSACAKIYKKSFIKDTRFYLGMRANEDSFFIFELALKKPRFTILNKVVYSIRIVHTSASRSKKTDSYKDIIRLAEIKYDRIIKEFPEYKYRAKNILIGANLATLKRLLNIEASSETKDCETKCIKFICKNSANYVPSSKFNEKFLFIITHHLYYVLKKYHKVKNHIRYILSKVFL